MITLHQTKGGTLGHITRRLIHISIIFLPFIYYDWIVPTVSNIRIAHHLIILAMIAVLIFELLRLKCRFVIFAQRDYEATQICSFAWGILSIGFVLLFSPTISFSVAIIASCALVDPLLGELKTKIKRSIGLFLVGMIAVILIWLICALHYHTPIWIAFLMGPITVLCEWPSFKWIDDNALMMLIPLIVVLIIH